MIETILTVANVVAWVATAAFIARYSRVHFERTPEGKNVMFLAGAILILATTGIFRRFLEISETLQVTISIAWVAVAFLMVQRTILLVKAQNKGKTKVKE